MSSSNHPNIQVHKAAGYIPSDRAVEALEELAAALHEEFADAEVAGFAKIPQVGTEFKEIDVRRRFTAPEAQDFCGGIYGKSGDTELCFPLFWG